MATSLSEILQAKGDADYANGGEGGAISPDLYSSAAANEYLQHAGDLQYQANRYLAEQHDRNMQQTLKGLNDVDFKDMLPQDSQDLMKEYTGVIQNTASNFGVIRNPLSNPQAYADLKSKESNFRQRMSQAQNDAAFIQKQNEFVQLHPEFNTPEYQQNLKNFMSQPVGQRQHFAVTPPSVINWDAIGKTASDLATKKTITKTTDGRYILKGTEVDPNAYMNWFTPANLSNTTDSLGRPLYQQMVKQYNDMPANMKSQFANQDDFIQKMAKYHMQQNQQLDQDADKYGEIGANFKKQMALERYREDQENKRNTENNDVRLQIEGLKKGKEGAIDVNATGAYINKAFHDMATSTPNNDNLDKLNAIHNNRNLSSAQRIKMMDAYANDAANYTRVLPNALLQSSFGDNTPTTLKKKAADNTNKTDGITTSSETDAKVPTGEVIGNKLSNDRQSVIISIRNNMTGQINSHAVPLNKFYDDLSGVLGEKNAPKVQEAAREWLQKNTGEVTPDVDKLHTIFAPNTPAPAATPGTEGNVDEINKKLGNPNYQYTMPNGQTASMKDLMKHYTQDEISAGLQQGKIK